MSVGYFILGLNLAVATISADPILKPCRKDDEACISASTKAAYNALIQGVPEIGVESSDPIQIDVTDGNLAGLKYTFTDYTFTGLKECTVDAVTLEMEESAFNILLDCPKGYFSGDYELSGKLIVLPVEGKGKFSMEGTNLAIQINSEMKKVETPDGKSHLNIKNFKVEVNPGNVRYEFQNLFNGQKDLSDAVHNFANENWKEVAHEFQGPVWNSIFKKVIKNMNKYLKTVPVNDLFL